MAVHGEVGGKVAAAELENADRLIGGRADRERIADFEIRRSLGADGSRRCDRRVPQSHGAASGDLSLVEAQHGFDDTAEFSGNLDGARSPPVLPLLGGFVLTQIDREGFFHLCDGAFQIDGARADRGTGDFEAVLSEQVPYLSNILRGRAVVLLDLSDR